MVETDRLFLRHFELSDAKIVQELAGDYEIARTTLNIPHPYPDGAAEAWIERTHRDEQEGKSYTFAIVRKLDNVLMGAIGLGVVKSHNRAELAYWLGKPYWGSGYTTEAARSVIAYGFEQLSLHRIYAYAMTKNPASTGVMKKAGMKYEGTLYQHLLKWDQYEDTEVYGMLRSDYLKRNE